MDIWCLPQLLDSLLLETGLSLKLELPDWLNWVASKPPETLLSVSSELGIQV